MPFGRATSLHTTSTRRLVTSSAAVFVFAAAGCAEPCVDDGLGQDFCPGVNSNSNSASGTDSMGDGSSADDEGGDMDGDSCPVLDRLLTPQVPTIQFLVDRSGSMNDDFGGPTRWDALNDTLIGGNGAIISSLQSEIRFGMSLYTGDGMTCPQLVEVGAQLDASDEIQTLLANNGPASETPTGESFVMAAATLEADDWEGDKFIVLATDGAPDTCAVPNPMAGTPEEAAAQQAVVDAVSDAFDKGIRTFVISVGPDVADAHLQAVANAGAGVAAGEPDAPFYKALGQQALTDAFDEIIEGVRECKLDLSEPLKADLASSCTVTVNDSAVPYDDPNGWTLDGDTVVLLQGSACTQIQEGVVSIEMSCSCEVTQ